MSQYGQYGRYGQGQQQQQAYTGYQQQQTGSYQQQQAAPYQQAVAPTQPQQAYGTSATTYSTPQQQTAYLQQQQQPQQQQPAYAQQVAAGTYAQPQQHTSVQQQPYAAATSTNYQQPAQQSYATSVSYAAPTGAAGTYTTTTPASGTYQQVTVTYQQPQQQQQQPPPQQQQEQQYTTTSYQQASQSGAAYGTNTTAYTTAPAGTATAVYATTTAGGGYQAAAAPAPAAPAVYTTQSYSNAEAAKAPGYSTQQYTQAVQYSTTAAGGATGYAGAYGQASKYSSSQASAGVPTYGTSTAGTGVYGTVATGQAAGYGSQGGTTTYTGGGSSAAQYGGQAGAAGAYMGGTTAGVGAGVHGGTVAGYGGRSTAAAAGAGAAGSSRAPHPAKGTYGAVPPPGLTFAAASSAGGGRGVPSAQQAWQASTAAALALAAGGTAGYAGRSRDTSGARGGKDSGRFGGRDRGGRGDDRGSRGDDKASREDRAGRNDRMDRDRGDKSRGGRGDRAERSPPRRQPQTSPRRAAAPVPSVTADRGRSRSPPVRRPEYAVRVPLYPFATSLRDYSEVARRYTHMYIVPDFTKVVFRWPEKQKSPADALGCTTFKLDNHAMISYVPTAADRALREKLRSRDKRGGRDGMRDRDHGSERRSPGWSSGKMDDRDRSGADEDTHSSKDSKEIKKAKGVAAGDREHQDRAADGPADDKGTPIQVSASEPKAADSTATDTVKQEEVLDGAAIHDQGGKDIMEACLVNGVKWMVKAVLVCGLNPQQVQSVIAGPAHAGGHHLSSQLRFVALRNAARPADLAPLGGPWDPELDGGDPASGEDGCFIRALIRNIKHQVGLDISGLGPQAWMRFADIHYSRSGARQTDTVSAAGAAVEAGLLKQLQAEEQQQQASTAGPANAPETAGALGATSARTDGTLLEGLTQLAGHDPAGQVHTEVTVLYLIDISSLMPKPVQQKSPSVLVAKTEVKQEPQQPDQQQQHDPQQQEQQQQQQDSEQQQDKQQQVELQQQQQQQQQGSEQEKQDEQALEIEAQQQQELRQEEHAPRSERGGEAPTSAGDAAAQVPAGEVAAEATAQAETGVDAEMADAAVNGEGVAEQAERADVDADEGNQMEHLLPPPAAEHEELEADQKDNVPAEAADDVKTAQQQEQAAAVVQEEQEADQKDNANAPVEAADDVKAAQQQEQAAAAVQEEQEADQKDNANVPVEAADDVKAAQQQEQAAAVQEETIPMNKTPQVVSNGDSADKHSKTPPGKDKPPQTPRGKASAAAAPSAITLTAFRHKDLLLEPHTFTLSGLLDYDEQDDQEPVMELSLLAEGFHEMLMRDYGETIARALLADRPSAWRRELEEEAVRLKIRQERRQKDEEDRKRRDDRRSLDESRNRDEDENLKRKRSGGEDASHETGAKKPKTGDSAEQTEPSAAAVGGEVVDGTEKDSRPRDDNKDALDGAAAADKGKKESSNTERPSRRRLEKRINEQLLAAFRYFDKTGTGYLRVEDLRRIIHNLGAGLCHRSVKALVHSVADPQGGWRGERVYYRDLTDTELTVAEGKVDAAAAAAAAEAN